MEFHHVSVMLEEAVSGLVKNPDGVYVDCTLGGAGHSAKIVSMLSRAGRLIGIDQDEAAIATARERLTGADCRVDIVRSNFSRFSNIMDELDIPFVDGVLFDLGVSSYQIDTAERGFSYMHDAPLDMRMDLGAELSAYDVVNRYSEDDLTRIFTDYGEERWARRIARFIVDERKERPLKTTSDLVDAVKRAVPSAVRHKENGHPAKRVFQAVRIEVNNELGILEDTFKAAVSRLKPGGRIVVITFHSLEDRIAKNTLRDMAKGCICPPELPVCVCHHKPEVKLIEKGRRPSKEEIEQNPRAKSAKLRIAEKLPAEGKE